MLYDWNFDMNTNYLCFLREIFIKSWNRVVYAPYWKVHGEICITKMVRYHLIHYHCANSDHKAI